MLYFECLLFVLMSRDSFLSFVLMPCSLALCSYILKCILLRASICWNHNSLIGILYHGISRYDIYNTHIINNEYFMFAFNMIWLNYYWGALLQIQEKSTRVDVILILTWRLRRRLNMGSTSTLVVLHCNTIFLSILCHEKCLNLV